MWNSKGLSSIASCVGVPIMLDKQTLNRTRMSYARVCVEIDTSCEFPSSIPVYLDGMLAFEVDVEYPWKPPMYTHCKTFNHSSIACKKVVEIVQKNPITQGSQCFTSSTQTVSREGLKGNSTGSSHTIDQEGGARSHFIKTNDGGPSKLAPVKNTDLKRSGRDNYNNDTSGRIWIGWDPCEVKITILHSSAQCIFVLVDTIKGFYFVATFVYGNNDIGIRRYLWEDICNFSQYNSRPWIILGDFNFILSPTDKTGGAEIRPYHYQYLSNCVQEAHLMDLPYSGGFYTWFNKKGATRIGFKIDRIMVNMERIDQFVDSKAEFLPPGVSDHSTSVASIFEKRKHGPPPFRFFNYMTEEPGFLELIRRI
ncbi:uncharacterized protein LOC113359566 [Papaver somniferum]|uniref:uncharacterized protein LOC113359566 n=1 Tax=Papaver somniferum TaxID=3469 RepID=UPI000E703735|nr:uncharacterized protein LOC113359566 [Papaver somniferum]